MVTVRTLRLVCLEEGPFRRQVAVEHIVLVGKRSMCAVSQPETGLVEVLKVITYAYPARVGVTKRWLSSSRNSSASYARWEFNHRIFKSSTTPHPGQSESGPAKRRAVCRFHFSVTSRSYK